MFKRIETFRVIKTAEFKGTRRDGQHEIVFINQLFPNDHKDIVEWKQKGVRLK